MRTQILQCDICGKTHKGNKLPNSWYEFYYEFFKVGEKSQQELEYLVCSFKCHIEQLKKCLIWSSEHCNVKIAGMTVQFTRKLLDGICVKEENPMFIQPINDLKEIEIEVEVEKKQEPTFAIEKPKRKGKVISLDLSKENWVLDFSFNNSDSILLDRACRQWEKDNLTIYDGSLIDIELPTIPLIKYKNHYKLFIYESMIDEIELLKQSNI